MRMPSYKTAALVLLVGASALMSCSKGLVGPGPSPEVYILDGLVFEYGAETPCYLNGVEEHGTRCGAWGKELKQAYPVVQVQLQPFAIDQSEVSNQEYRHCVETGSCEDLWFTDSFDQGIDYYMNSRYDDYPVHQVSWSMAQAYCEAQGRRLPTDAEWQRVAQGSRVLGTHRVYPAEGIKTLEDCLTPPNGSINAIACNAVKEFTRVNDPGGDYVNEGYTAELEAARVFHLFSNVSEFTGGPLEFYQEDVTCQETLPTGYTDGGDYTNLDNCIACESCEDLLSTGGQRTPESDQCYQECKICEACEGSLQDSTPYYTEGYPIGPLDCFIDCWGESRENPSCVRWGLEDQPLVPSAVQGIGIEKSVRGGHVGIPLNSTDECRYRSDYRDKRYQPDGSPDTSNLATAKGVGFRCARDLTQGELDALQAQGDPRFVHLFGGEPEVLDVVHPKFCAEICDNTCTTESCACSIVAGWSGSDCSYFNCREASHCAAHGDTNATCKPPMVSTNPQWTCECDEDGGWSGPDCAFACTSDGQCTSGGDGSAVCTSGGACDCSPSTGWSGVNCSDFACASNDHCNGEGDSGATCDTDAGTCTCSPDTPWVGADCATFACSTSEACRAAGDGGATCTLGNKSCQCDPNSGWSGKNCSTFVCSLAAHCNTGDPAATCDTNTGECVCSGGSEAKDCVD